MFRYILINASIEIEKPPVSRNAAGYDLCYSKVV